MATLANYNFGDASATNVAAGLALSNIDASNVLTPSFDHTGGGAATAPVFRLYPKLGTVNADGAVAVGSYFEFTITPNANKKFTLAAINFAASRAGTNGGERGFALRTSADAYATNVLTSAITSVQPAVENFSAPLTITDRTTPLTVRIYAYSPESQGHNYDSFVIDGSVADIEIGLPDLTVDTVTPADTAIGVPVLLSAVVHNNGGAPTPAVPHKVSFSVSDGAEIFSTNYTTPIAPGGSAIVTSDTNWTPSVPGPNTVDVIVNDDQSITESNYANNATSAVVNVLAPGTGVTSFAGRDGDVVPLQSDYDAFFLTPAEGDVRYAPISGGGDVVSVFGRTGAVVAQQADYDAFFLTQAEGDARYTQLSAGVASFNGRTGTVVPQQADYDGFFLTPTEANAAYLTQAQANSQGMPAVELGAVGSGSPVRKVNANYTLLAPTEPSRFLQGYFNTAASQVTASAPAGYTIVGSAAHAANTWATFIKEAGTQTFRRLS